MPCVVIIHEVDVHKIVFESWEDSQIQKPLEVRFIPPWPAPPCALNLNTACTIVQHKFQACWKHLLIGHWCIVLYEVFLRDASYIFSANIKQFSCSTAVAVLQDCWILLSNLRWRWTIHSMMRQITYAFHTGTRSVSSQKQITVYTHRPGHLKLPTSLRLVPMSPGVLARLCFDHRSSF